MDLAGWLQQQGLTHLETQLLQAGIELDVLWDLESADLIELGLNLGDRKRLLKAISSSKPIATTSEVERQPEAPALVIDPSAERRQLTVMFCDLVGSTDLSARLDPEDLRNVVRAYQKTAEEVIQRYGGHIAQYLGDGLLVYFGYPVAHEDDAQRAVHAGIGISQSMVELNTRLEADYAVRLSVRIGIHTGPVVVGEMGGKNRQENLAMGETPNLAARLQGLAEPGAVVISGPTHQLVSGRFELEGLGLQTLKGLSTPQEPYRVLGVVTTESRFAARSQGAPHAMVGREDELALLVRRWQRARAGESQIVFVSGEPGIGKSHLIQALRDRIEGESHRQVLLQCSSFLQSSPFHPFIAQLRRAGRIEPALEDAKSLQRLDIELRRSAAFVEEDTPLFAGLLELPCELPPVLREPDERRRRTVAGLFRYLTALAADQPALAIVEDVHWADPATIEVLDRAVQGLTDTRLLLILTFRPEFECPWTGRSRTTALGLSRISARETAELVATVSGAAALPEHVLATIIKRTDGIPLFVEELTRAVVELAVPANVGELVEATIPSSLHDSLMERLDRLGRGKEIAQAGAVIGREFNEDQVTTLTGLASATVSSGLVSLQQAGLIFKQTDGAFTSFKFKHALVQDAAYQSMLQVRRKSLHDKAAHLLLAQRAPPEIVAHHFEQCGNTLEALNHWQEAARRASDEGAHSEALTHFSHAVGLLEGRPANPAESPLACDLLLGLAGSMRVLDRVDEALEVLGRAEPLALEMDDHRRLADICLLRGNLYFPLSNIDGCMEQHVRSRELAQLVGDPEREARALSGLGDASYLRGALITAHGYFNRCVEIGQEQDFSTIVAANLPMRAWCRFVRLDVIGGSPMRRPARGAFSRPIS